MNRRRGEYCARNRVIYPRTGKPGAKSFVLLLVFVGASPLPHPYALFHGRLLMATMSLGLEEHVGERLRERKRYLCGKTESSVLGRLWESVPFMKGASTFA